MLRRSWECNVYLRLWIFDFRFMIKAMGNDQSQIQNLKSTPASPSARSRLEHFTALIDRL
jgi:hypothetical protein